MLFKTNTNGHKHPSISLIIIEQDTIGEIKENNKWRFTQEPRTPPKQSYKQWWSECVISSIVKSGVNYLSIPKLQWLLRYLWGWIRNFTILFNS